VRWTESGGPAVQPPSRKGFGSRLLDGGLASDLGGKPRLVFAETGVEAFLPVRFAS
jgi:two-component sensor histidine kinase